jgi:thiamine-phosphate pyrophosphorylase
LSGPTTVTRIGRLRLPTLCLITDRKRLGESPLEAVLGDAVKGGINIVQLREGDLPAGELLTLTTRVRKATRGHSLLIINDRLDVVMAAGADGIHLPESGLPVAIARWLLGQHVIIGRSVHSKEAAIEAEQDGADYVQLGTIYATTSKPDLKPAGPDLLREVSAALTIPILAVAASARERRRGHRSLRLGASVIRPSDAAEPQAAARQLVEVMAEAWKKRVAPSDQEKPRAAKAR